MKKRTRTYLWGILAAVVIFAGFKLISASPSSSATPTETTVDGQLTLIESQWDLGDVSMANGINIKSIVMQNETSSPITVTAMETSCMCTTAQIVHEDGSKSAVKGMIGHGGGTATMSETIQPGESAALLVNFDPNAHGPNAIGPITRTVSMRTNSQTQKEISMTFTGNVIK